MCYIGIKGFVDGKPQYLVSFFDSDTTPNACGYGLTKDYPYLYFTEPTSEANMAKTICVKTCPPNTAANYALDCKTTSTVNTCT